MKKNLKAQAAMEYLMTYGWAILIVVIVAAALFALGVFNPGTFTGERCTGFSNLGCPSEWQVTDAGAFNVVVKNGLGEQISISNVNVTIGTDYAGTTSVPADAVSSGSTKAYSPVGAGTEFLDLNSVDPYIATVEVKYTVGSGTFDRIESGTLTGSVV